MESRGDRIYPTVRAAGGLLRKGVLAGTVLVSTAAPGPPLTELASVAGIVMSGETGLPLEGAQVSMRGGEPVRVLRATTNALGQYVIDAVEPGSYVVQVSRAGFVSLHFGQRSTDSARSVLHVKQGQKLARINVILPAAATIDGRVTFVDGTAAKGLPISALRIEPGAGTSTTATTVQTAKTDSDGRYRLTGLNRGDYYVTAGMPSAPPAPGVQPGSRNNRPVPVYYPGVGAIEDALPVSLDVGQSIGGVHITARPVSMAVIKGKVVTERPAVGTLLTLLRSGTVGGVVASGMAAVDGVFVLGPVPLGRYMLQGRSLPLDVVEAIASTGSSAPIGESDSVQFGISPVEANEAGVAEMVLHTRPAGGVKGTVTTRTGSLPPALTVAAHEADAYAFAVAASAASVRDDGTFDIKGLLGSFVLRVGGLPTGWQITGVHAGATVSPDAALAVSAGQIIEVVIDVALERTAIAGRVTSDCGVAVECHVLAFSRDASKWRLPSTRYILVAQTTAGRFTIPGLPSGAYYVAAVTELSEERQRDAGYLSVLARSPYTARTDVSPGRTADVVLKRPVR